VLFLNGTTKIDHTAPWPRYPNTNVFRDCRNLLYDKSASFRCDGRLFHRFWVQQLQMLYRRRCLDETEEQATNRAEWCNVWPNAFICLWDEPRCYNNVTEIWKQRVSKAQYISGCVGSTVVRASDFRTSCRGFDSRPGRNQVTYVNSAFDPSRVGKASTSLTGWG